MRDARAPRSAHLARAVAALVVALSLAQAAPAGAAEAPSPEQVQEQQRQATLLEREADEQEQRTASARERLAALGTEAGRALEEYDQARMRTVRVQEVARAAEQQLADARAEHEAAQKALDTYASSTYRSGGTALSQVDAIGGLLRSGSPTEFPRMLATVDWIADQQSASVDRLRRAEWAQEAAAEDAQRALDDARAAEADERRTKERADALVAEQRDLVEELEAELERARGAATLAKERADAMARARREADRRAAEEKRRRAAALAQGEAVLGSGGCGGGSLDGYENGRLPLSELCPLWGAPGHLLQADAARDFNAMSKAYAADFGSPICVTDSYRSYAMQVDAHERKPEITAEPGTSNHGWARAVDLCDGINRFGTRQHEWMQVNASRFGWYHPGWAEPGGSRPEPWHWEYGG